MKSGLRFSTGDATESGARVVVEAEYELSYVHRSIGLVLRAGIYKLYDSVFMALTGASSAAKNAFSNVRNGGGIKPATVTLNAGDFLVVAVADLRPQAGLRAATMAEATALQRSLVAENPHLRGQVQVVAAHELETA
jgi:hypothetical protein